MSLGARITLKGKTQNAEQTT